MPCKLKDLIKGTKAVSKARVVATPSASFHYIKTIPMLGVKTLLIEGLSHIKLSTSGKEYKCFLYILDVEYSNKAKLGYRKLSDHKNVFITPILDNRIQVFCQCPDYYFTWSYWNWKNHCHFGRRPRKYIRKTTTYPERNPKHVPGMCKHLLHLVHANQKLFAVIPT